jgi:tetratricopeptide (TPR) repeat protein
MSNISLCVGNYATTPYCLERTNIAVSSIEELCYVLKENAFLLDSRIVNRKLVDWIFEECGLGDLSRNLYSLLNSGGSVSAFVACILEYVHYLEPKQIKEIETLLRENANLSEIEKRKVRGDYAIKNRKYLLAIEEYNELSQLIGDNDSLLLGRVYHNAGVAYASMFIFEEAEHFFYKAYEKLKNEESYLQYLAAVRMQKTQEEYISFIAEMPDAYEISLKLERELEQITSQWKATKNKIFIDEMQQMKALGNTALYYKKVDEVVTRLKEEYRESVVEY